VCSGWLQTWQILLCNRTAGNCQAGEGVHVQYPLSPDEHVAMARYLSGIRKQLQDTADLFTARYGKDSSIAEVAVRTLISAALLEHELTLLEGERESSIDSSIQGITSAW
jgi:hypothetical protein